MARVFDIARYFFNYVRSNRKKKALFLHIQKTAGTSIVHLAHQHYLLSMTSHGDHVGKSPDSLKKTQFVSGHFGYDFASQLMADRYSFTFLRVPKSRVLSMYYFLRDQEVDLFPMYKLAKELSLEEFLKAGFSDSMVRQRLWNNQVWQLAHGWANRDNKKVENFEPEELLDLAKSHLDAFDHVGFTETFQQDCEIILKGLNLPAQEEKVAANKSSRKKNVDLSVEANDLLDELTVLDRELYDFAWNKFH